MLSRLSASDPLPDAAVRHLNAAKQAVGVLCKSQQAEYNAPVEGWATALQSAIAARSARWASALSDVADIRAKKLEGIVATARKMARAG